MDRNREARRSTSMAAPNGLARRRHRTSLRDSPEEDGPLELQETTRLRDRGGSVKKDRDRTRDRDRDRDRDRLSRNKRRAERMLHGSNREDGDDTSEESVNDEEEEDDERGGAGGSGHMRFVPPPSSNYQPSSLSSSMSNHNNRRNFPPAAAAAAKVFRPAAPWKPADEMIGVSVPRKARSASIKRSHEWLSSGGHIVAGSSGEHILRQASASPVRTNLPGPTASPVRPISPSSSNASGRKKMKPNGQKLLPPKSSSKSSSSDQEEIEIEIAEVLYGMMRQPQVPAKPDVSDSMRFESSREESRFAGDAKSRISSPSPNSPSPALAQNLSSMPTPLSVTAPKRKKPRQVKYDDESQPATLSVRNSPISAATTKSESDQMTKVDAATPNLEKVRGSVKENGVGPYDLAKPAVEAQLRKVDDTHELKTLRGEAGAAKEGPPQSSSPLKESSSHRLDDNRVDTSMKATKASEIENQREEKFQIDLMAPPPTRSSPDKNGDVYLSAGDPKKSLVPDMKTESNIISSNDERPAKVVAEGGELNRLNAVAEEAKSSAEAQKTLLPKEKMIDLQLDLEKAENGAAPAASFSKLSKLNQQFLTLRQQSLSQPEKNAQPNNPMSYPMSIPGWPGAIPPIGYMAAPMQGVVSMDGTTVASTAAIQPQQWLFNQPRQKKCATHCYIARNIQHHQQMTRMNPFWQPAAAAAASASMYGGVKPTNLNMVPSSESHGAAQTNRAAGNLMPEKSQNLSLFPGKEKAPPSNGAGIEASQRKQQQQQQQQVLLQQSLPAGAPNNILGPAFIFPLSQQHAAAAAAAAAASVRSGGAAGKPNNAGTAPSSATTSTSPSPAISASAAAATATAMSFNYPNMPSGETQYLAILQNNPYPFPVPAHVGAGPQYRGNPAQAMPFFNGSFYSSQMLHPSQLQHAPNPSQQQQQQQTQNGSISTSSSSSQKHLQSQQHRPQSSIGNGSLQGFPAAKHPSSQQQQQQQQQQNQHGLSHHGDGAEDADGRASRSNMNIYAQSFPMAMHAQNFTLMQQSAAAAAAANASSPGHTNEKKLHQHQQQGSSKAGFDSLPSQAFAMSFASMNGGSAPAQNLDMAPSHASMLQSLPEATRHSYQMFAAAAAAQSVQKKNFRASEDGKGGGGGGGNDSAASADDDRKSMVGKAQGPPPTMGHIAFSRPDLTETANVVDSSARTLNLGSASTRMPSNALSSAASQQQQLQRNHHQQQQQQQHLQQQQQQFQHQQQQQQHQQQMIQLQKQQQYAVAAAAAAARSKSQAVVSNVSGGADQLSSAAAAVKSPPNALSSFAQNLVQSSNGPSQSPQWKSSSNVPRGSATAASTQSQVPPTLNSATASMKGHPQQQSRPLQGQTQISFANSKQAQNASQQQQQQQQQSSNQAAQQAVGSPTASSMSKSAGGGGGSPRTSVTSSSTGNKTTQQGSSLSNHQQQGKTSSSSIPGHKSSPVTGNVPSMLGNSHIMSSSVAAGTKLHQQQQQLQQQQQMLQQQQQQLQKQQQSLQQTQLFFTHPYMQVHNPHSPNAASAAAAATNAYYHGRRSSDPQQQLKQQPQQQQQQQHGTSSSGMLSLCSPTNNSTCDPVKAVAASNMKSGGGGHHSQGILHSAPFAVSGSPHQLAPAGFTYVHTMPNAGQVKAAEQKQPAAAREESRRSDN